MRKTCSKCGHTKDLACFHKRKKSSDGRTGICKDCANKAKREWVAGRREKVNEYKRNWYRQNLEQERKRNRESQRKHRSKRTAYENERYRNDIEYRLKKVMSQRIRHAVSDKAGKQTKELIGCDVAHLKTYIETQFTEGMTWANYGEWHIDHIQPCASFDLTNDTQLKKCFHYTNLQPLWASENCSKGAKIAAGK